eukprot:m.103084 g.103084  ORF g.103084 m.103084 type:complete len:433 (-) comp13228_c0_seq16:1491-2789(-)
MDLEPDCRPRTPWWHSFHVDFPYARQVLFGSSLAYLLFRGLESGFQSDIVEAQAKLTELQQTKVWDMQDFGNFMFQRNSSTMQAAVQGRVTPHFPVEYNGAYYAYLQERQTTTTTVSELVQVKEGDKNQGASSASTFTPTPQGYNANMTRQERRELRRKERRERREQRRSEQSKPQTEREETYTTSETSTKTHDSPCSLMPIGAAPGYWHSIHLPALFPFFKLAVRVGSQTNITQDFTTKTGTAVKTVVTETIHGVPANAKACLLGTFERVNDTIQVNLAGLEVAADFSIFISRAKQAVSSAHSALSVSKVLRQAFGFGAFVVLVAIAGKFVIRAFNFAECHPLVGWRVKATPSLRQSAPQSICYCCHDAMAQIRLQVAYCAHTHILNFHEDLCLHNKLKPVVIPIPNTDAVQSLTGSLSPVVTWPYAVHVH